jgi:hypothetical protein
MLPAKTQLRKTSMPAPSNLPAPRKTVATSDNPIFPLIAVQTKSYLRKVYVPDCHPPSLHVPHLIPADRMPETSPASVSLFGRPTRHTGSFSSPAELPRDASTSPDAGYPPDVRPKVPGLGSRGSPNCLLRRKSVGPIAPHLCPSGAPGTPRVRRPPSEDVHVVAPAQRLCALTIVSDCQTSKSRS